MRWTDRNRLEVTYKADPAMLYYQVVETSGVQIAVQDLSNGQDSPHASAQRDPRCMPDRSPKEPCVSCIQIPHKRGASSVPKLDYAKQIASQLHTSPRDSLSLSGNESGWGTGFLITAGTNNYFSVTEGRAFGGTIRTYHHGSYTYAVYPSPGFLTAGQSFGNSDFGARVNGITDPLAFSQALIASGSTINLANSLIGCHN